MAEFETPAVNPDLSGIIKTSSSTVDVLLQILQQITALNTSTGGSNEITGATADISGVASTVLTEKSFIAIERMDGATGSITIDSITYGVDDPLPIFPFVGATNNHRSIQIVATAATGVIIHYLNTI